jgi:hypothetical protein
MKVITVQELINYFAECNNIVTGTGILCSSFDINYEKNRFEITSRSGMDKFPFDKNKEIRISNKGEVALTDELGYVTSFFFTKTLTPRDFE